MSVARQSRPVDYIDTLDDGQIMQKLRFSSFSFPAPDFPGHGPASRYHITGAHKRNRAKCREAIIESMNNCRKWKTIQATIAAPTA